MLDACLNERSSRVLFRILLPFCGKIVWVELRGDRINRLWAINEELVVLFACG